MDNRQGPDFSGSWSKSDKRSSRSGRVPKQSETSLSNPLPDENLEDSRSVLDFQPGDTIGGTYCILAHLGRGGMGYVFEVEHIMLRQTYALKILTADSASGTSWKRFQTEARTIARLDHPNIVKVHNLGIHNEKTPFYVMDLLEGETLSSLVHRLGRVDPLDCIELFVPLCRGLAYAHANGIVHRDLKPSNIMLIVQNNKVVPKLVDFGLVKLVGSSALSPSQQLTASGEVFGSPLYMSPEQSVGRHINERSDIYSLGCSLFQALSGAPPFVGENVVQTIMKHQNEAPPTLRQASMGLSFSPEWEAVVARALAKEADDRYQTMNEFARDLLAIKAGKKLNLASMTAGSDIFTDTDDDEDEELYGAQNNLSGTHRLPGGQKNSGISRNKEVERQNKIWKIVAVSLAVLLIGGIAGGFLYLQKSEKQKEAARKHVDTFEHEGSDVETRTTTTKVAEPVVDENFENTAMPFLQNDGKLVDGKWIYKFPDQSIGNLVANYAGGHDKNASFDARGEVAVNCTPEEPKLAFEAAAICGAHPKIFRRFGATEICDVSFLRPTPDTDDELFFLNHMHSLALLSVANTDVTPRGLDIIGQFPQLIVLDVSHTKNLTGADLAKLKNLNQLVELRVKGGQKLAPLLQVLGQNAPKLKALTVDDVPLSAEDLKLLTEMKQLIRLSMTNCGLTDDALKPFNDMPNLQNLGVGSNNFTPKIIDMLKDNQHLSWLEVTPTGWSDEDIERLKTTFIHRVKVFPVE